MAKHIVCSRECSQVPAVIGWGDLNYHPKLSFTSEWYKYTQTKLTELKQLSKDFEI